MRRRACFTIALLVCVGAVSVGAQTPARFGVAMPVAIS